MNHNDVMRSVRYTLDANDDRLADIVKLGGGEASIDDVRGFLKDPDDASATPIDDRTMAQFLDGVIYALRGRDESRPAPPPERVTNNVVLKKLRVAYSLQEADLLAIFAAGGHDITKPELSSFLRKPDNSHFRACGDQYLRAFLKGLALRVRGA